MTCTRENDLFLTKFGYYLDIIQQVLFSRLLQHCSSKNPLLKAKKKELQDFMVTRIRRFVNETEKRCRHEHRTPVITTAHQQRLHSQVTEEREKRQAGQEIRQHPTLAQQNPKPVVVWKLPEGKMVADFLNP